jgi:hypothetical protein
MDLYLRCPHADSDSIISSLYGAEFCIEVVLMMNLRVPRCWGIYRSLRCDVFTFLNLTMGWVYS